MIDEINETLHSAPWDTAYKRHKNSFNVYLNIVTLHDVMYVQKRDIAHPLQFISNKRKGLTLLWDESYHNTFVYHIN